MGQEATQYLLLFSSNQRALYAQDASNTAAGPTGGRYRFRYQKRWVGETTRTTWEQNKLVGTAALVVFSFQHQTHPSAGVRARPNGPRHPIRS
jgi:hypothetical protein